MDDPWDWDVDRIVQEFCTPNRTWLPHREPPALPPLAQLEVSLREQEVDGYTLITYSDRSDIHKELGIKKLNQKATFDNAIEQFRKRSRKYQRHQMNDQDLELPDAPPDVQTNGPSAKNRLMMELGGLSKSLGNEDQRPELPEATTEPRKNHSTPPPITPAAPVAPAVPTNFSAPEPVPGPEPTPGSSSVPTPKRRRIAPTTITPDVDRNTLRNIPTAADEISGVVSNAIVARAPAIRSFEAYLGVNALSRIDLLEPSSPSSDGLTPTDKQFTFIGGNLPPGRRFQVHYLFKRHLLPKRPPGRVVRTRPDTVYGANDPNCDEVLPPYGESDDNGESDSDFYEEYEEELRDRKAAGDGHTGIAFDRVNALIDEVIERQIDHWKDHKLPKLSRRAYTEWSEARKRGLNTAIRQQRQLVADLDARVEKYRKEILQSTYQKDAEVLLISRVFEQTIDEKETALWKIGILYSSEKPQRPPRLPRSAARKRRTARRVGDDDSEVLTSGTDDDGLDNFVIDNEIPRPQDAPVNAQESHSSNNPEIESAAVDEDNDHRMGEPDSPKGSEASLPVRPNIAEVTKDPRTPSKQRTQPQVIDLTSTPIKHKVPDNPSRSQSSSSKRRDTDSSLDMDISDFSLHEQTIALQLQLLDKKFLATIFTLVFEFNPIQIWTLYVVPALQTPNLPRPPYSDEERDVIAGFRIIQMFDIWLETGTANWSYYKQLDYAAKEQLIKDRGKEREQFELFIDFVERASARFEWTRIRLNPAKLAQQRAMAQAKANEVDMADASLDEVEYRLSDKTKRRRKVKPVNRAAQNLRQTDLERIREQESRRDLLRAKLEASGEVMGSQRAMIINESKQEDEGFVYVNSEIAPRIKEHQVAGVRFMWNQIVSKSESRQGCLLAHTMGLGKTMQIITLLVAIAEAAASPDESVSSQVPDDLKESKTLVIPPPGLVNNWMDELLTWTPENHCLGEFYKISSQTLRPQRARIIESWSVNGGVLIISYKLLIACMREDSNLDSLLCEMPNIVVADEAHAMKNPRSQVHIACNKFRTKSRIALTGSPLANNVEEYHSMINWVAPNYLSDLAEFRVHYAKPIRDGLSVDSTAYARRKALTRLHALKKTVDPKIHRLTISVLKNDIPPKTEFVLFVPLTAVQKKAYEMYMGNQARIGDGPMDPLVTSRIFASLNILRLLCAHPHCFLKYLEQKNGEKGKQISNSAEESVDEEATDEPDDRSDVNVASDFTLSPDLVSDQIAFLRKTKDIESMDHSWKMPLLDEILDESRRIGDGVLVFSQSIPTIDYLENVFRMQKRSVKRLDGGTAVNSRQTMVKEFNRSRTEVFLISTTAGGLGLNITGANRVVIFDFKFNPQQEQQAIGRAYRLGQTKPVFVYRFVCGGTFEDGLMDRSVFKMQLADRVIDKKNPIPKASHLKELLKMPTDPEQNDLSEHRGRDHVLDKLLKVDKLRAGIRSILLMDTFQEESLEDLPPDAAAEGEDLYKDLEEKRKNKALNPPPLPQQGESARSGTPATTNPQYGNNNNTATAVAQPVLTPTFNPFPPKRTNGHPQQPSLSQQLQPTMGASTGFRSQENQPYTAPDSTASQRSKMFIQELRRLCKADDRKLTSANSIIDAFTRAQDQALSTQNPANSLSNMDRIKMSIVDAAASDRFLFAAGVIAEWLPHASTIDMGRLRDYLERMDPREFNTLTQKFGTMNFTDFAQFIEKAGLKRTQGDPQVRHPANLFQSSLSQPQVSQPPPTPFFLPYQQPLPFQGHPSAGMPAWNRFSMPTYQQSYPFTFSEAQHAQRAFNAANYTLRPPPIPPYHQGAPVVPKYEQVAPIVPANTYNPLTSMYEQDASVVPTYQQQASSVPKNAQNPSTATYQAGEQLSPHSSTVEQDRPSSPSDVFSPSFPCPPHSSLVDSFTHDWDEETQPDTFDSTTESH